MFLGLAMILLAPMFAYACYLDMTLPKKWKRLPVFFRGAFMHRRRIALYYVPCFLVFVALGFLGIAISHDISPGIRSSREMALVSAAILSVVGLLYPFNVVMMRRWMRTGKPKLD